MKLIKLFFMLAIVSMIVVSCKESKKEEVQDADAVEMTEESSSESVSSDASSEGVDESATEGEGSASEAGAAAAAAAAGSKAPATGVEGASKDIEELVVPEGVLAEELADTPVIYPGCVGSAEEVRSCNKESFIAFIKKDFNKNLAPNLGLEAGDYQIKSIIHIDESGKISTLKVVAPHKALEEEMVRVIGDAPTVTPATKDGKPVAISFLLPVNFKVQI